MRLTQFILDIQQRFPIQSDHDLAHRIANAMGAAEHGVPGNTFDHDNVTYTITAEWKCSCYRGDCNPATCYTHWSLDTED